MLEEFWKCNYFPVTTPQLKFVIKGSVITAMRAHGGLINSAIGDQRVISTGQLGCIHLGLAKAPST